MLLDTCENLTFSISDSITFFGLPRLRNHVFISEICLQKSHSLEQILLTLSAWLYTMERLVWFGWTDVKCKYWYLSVGLIRKFVVSSAPDNRTSKSRKETQFLLKVFLFIFTLFAVDLKLLIYTKKSLYSLYSNNIELIDVNSVTEQEMQFLPKEFLKSTWTNWLTHTHLFTH